jgi:hypothetical protein
VRDANGNVFLHVPTAVAGVRAVPPGGYTPTNEDIIQWQASEIRALEARIAQQNLTGSQLIHISLAMAEWLIDLGYGDDAITVSVPIEFRKRIGEDNHLTISEGPDGCYVLMVREQGEPEDVTLAREQ